MGAWGYIFCPANGQPDGRPGGTDRFFEIPRYGFKKMPMGMVQIKIHGSDLVLLGFVLVAAALMAVYYGTDNNWISHAVLGLLALGLAFEISIVGAMMAGRIPRPPKLNLFWIHRSASTALALLTVGAFVAGLWVRLQHGDPLMATVHAWLGLAKCLIIVPQWFSCRFKARRSVKAFHMVSGWVFLVLVILQTGMGIAIGTFNYHQQ
jgi:hypothetical protein